MQFRQRLKEDDAVSPVIGVILMVAITVILAAVIASFVLGLGPDTATTPSASFSSDWDGSSNLEITMDSGDTVDGAKVRIEGDDGTGSDLSGDAWEDFTGGSSKITAGDSITVSGLSGGYEVNLVYQDGDTSSTMQTFEG